jgi:hypothetical protein
MFDPLWQCEVKGIDSNLAPRARRVSFT